MSLFQPCELYAHILCHTENNITSIWCAKLNEIGQNIILVMVVMLK